MRSKAFRKRSKWSKYLKLVQADKLSGSVALLMICHTLYMTYSFKLQNLLLHPAYLCCCLQTSCLLFSTMPVHPPMGLSFLWPIEKHDHGLIGFKLRCQTLTVIYNKTTVYSLCTINYVCGVSLKYCSQGQKTFGHMICCVMKSSIYNMCKVSHAD